MPRGRSNSPTSVVQYPTMSTPRTYWVINRNGATAVIDLYATRNYWFDKFLQYKMHITTHEQVQAFLDEMRFAFEPNLHRWNAIRHPRDGCLDPQMAEDWLWDFGIHHDLIDLTVILSDIEEDPEGEEIFHDLDQF